MPWILHALAAASQGIVRLKLYGYGLSEDDSGTVAASSAAFATRVRRPEHCLSPPPPATASAFGILNVDHSSPCQKGSGLSLPGTMPTVAAAPSPPQRCTAARRRQEAPSAAGPCNARGAPPLLRLLAHQLQELKLQDCSILSGNSRGGSTGPGPSGPGSGSGLVPATAVPGRGDGGGNGGCCTICGGAYGIPPAAMPLCTALRSCTALRHLGLRHSAADGCPVLQLLLQPGVCYCGGGSGRILPRWTTSRMSSCLPSGPTGSRAVGEDSGQRSRSGCGATAPALDRTTATTDQSLSAPPPPPPPAILGTLTQLLSLKVQTPLPAPGGLDALAAALRQLRGLTRLELGARTAVPSVASLLLRAQPLQATGASLSPQQPLLSNLRDLSLVSAQVTSAVELAALAELRELTRLSLGSLSVAVPTIAAAAAGPCEATGSGSGVQDSPRCRTSHQGSARAAASALQLPLPPRLGELSIAAPLSPATLLALRQPPSLQTLRLTGFTLDMNDVEDPGADGGGADDDGSAPLVMRTSSDRQLSEALAALHGRFAYRDLGIELHIGFLGPAAGRRRYLAAPDGAYRPVGHWTWASRLVPLALQGLELAGLELSEGDVSALARHLCTLEVRQVGVLRQEGWFRSAARKEKASAFVRNFSLGSTCHTYFISCFIHSSQFHPPFNASINM
ncbi:hypothetical protein VOLCADRAFT_87882 [Volvox carteri f. nagariensis]|uniref:Uncharacterized protein n=1 Tax=Volvox carteri f. nagariensis TaxID=3068 RepID=D8TMH5_VOLCA|nr:uncharacterized protein VOLCADRAFT_87882 [Volvox carteri f. nagariensis]EFJ51124.1 hypothetical protein VOLCADRAFT_87882 [Volvox carteri f. nagariensis]|eukprot:XP_002947591.1 hypothetical protein VOLCADRAFT_87882 [Volvox carteri f. nagariensis]